MLHEHQLPQVLDQVDDEPAEIVSPLRELLENVSAPAVSRSMTRSQRRKSASSSTVPSSSSTACTVTLFPVAEASWSSVDTASRYAPRRAARDERERLVGRVDPLGVGDLAQLP